ncbi:MAG: M42 family metallopeptidase [Pseudomonadota bacterium]|jgi:endoglucanase
MKLLKQLSEAPGVPGREEAIRDIVLAELKGKVDSLSVDAMGNVIAFKKGSARNPQRIMFAAHMDEIGFYVSCVDSKGFLRLHCVGSFDTRNLFSRRVIVHSAKGPLLGVLNATGVPIHLSSAQDRDGYKQISSFFVDLGMSAKEVKSKVVPGDMVTIDAQCIEYGNYICGKALDNRVQVYVGIRTLQALKNPKNDIFGVFTVQEEVGMRGAAPATFGVEPDIGIALDVTVASDIPGIQEEHYVTELGKGVAIKVLDESAISDRGLVDWCIATARKNKIPYQLELLPCRGTDAESIQQSRRGVKTVTLSVPTRYIHTTVESVHKNDLKSTEALLKALLSQ